MRVCGVDPGTTGYVVWIDLDDGEVKNVENQCLPYMENLICPHMLETIIARKHIDLLVIERSQGWTGDGGSRAFNYGMNFGIIHTVARQWEKKTERPNSTIYLYPQTWHAMMKVKEEKGKTKENALTRALEIIPDHQVFEDRGKIRDGLVDAFLIACAGYQSYCSGIRASN